MVGQMPVVESQVHQEKAQRKLCPRRQNAEMNETKRLFRGPAQGPSGGRLHQADRGDKSQRGNGAIDKDSCEEPARVLSQRKKALQQKQQQRQNANRNYWSDLLHFGFA
jgi:hypothetical protein